MLVQSEVNDAELRCEVPPLPGKAKTSWTNGRLVADEPCSTAPAERLDIEIAGQGFQGSWTDAGGTCCRIQGQKCYVPDGIVVLKYEDSGKVSFEIGASTYVGKLSDENDRILWEDGEAWVRTDTSTPREPHR